jgi:hypothetical protein
MAPNVASFMGLFQARRDYSWSLKLFLNGMFGAIFKRCATTRCLGDLHLSETR